MMPLGDCHMLSVMCDDRQRDITGWGDVVMADRYHRLGAARP